MGLREKALDVTWARLEQVVTSSLAAVIVTPERQLVPKELLAAFTRPIAGPASLVRAAGSERLPTWQHRCC